MKILIAGLAKTGTTGLLYLIANSLEKKPRLLFEPKTCPEDLHSPSGNLVAKVLIGGKLDAASFASFDRKITIVRDPRDRYISALLYSQYHARYLDDDARVGEVRRCLERKEADPAGVSLREMLAVIGRVARKDDLVASYRHRTVQSLEWFDDYVRTIPDGLLYRYEDFVTGRYAPLEAHLGMSLAGAATVPDKLSRVERTKGCGDWRHWFTAEDVAEYRPIFSPWLAKYGYDADDWSLHPRPVISPEHCSGYFMRLVAEYRNRPARKQGRNEAARQSGSIMRAKRAIVAGWAIGADPDEPVRVALLVNGREVARMVADQPRNGFKTRGVHPTGRCGFAFRLEKGQFLKPGDEVSVTAVGEPFELENSPSVVGEGPERAGAES